MWESGRVESRARRFGVARCLGTERNMEEASEPGVVRCLEIGKNKEEASKLGVD